ncbi:uncharacterized protein [Montipora foliosa]|uniref:uncharacterized protein n=1 Tax=Montipora foliosa TaxID=591990 RepID=UPI0035F1C191
MIFSNDKCHTVSSLLQDFNDGLFVHQHPLFSTDDNSLKLLIYYDDFNVANRMTNKVHQLGLFYYQLINTKSVYRGKLNSIHLFAICKKPYIKEFGLNKILKPLVDDLQQLGTNRGYPFTIAGGIVYLRAAVLAVIADTPASQAVGCFKEGVGGAKRKCFHCMATWEEMQEHFVEEDFVLRDSIQHEEQLSVIENAATEYLCKFYSKHYGINDRGKILDALHFDATQQLPQDIMHIFLEGIVTYEMKYLFKYLFDNRFFTLHALNQAIDDFDYGYSELNDKPAHIKEVDVDLKSSSNLGQSASEMWSLACRLPLLLDGKVDCNCPHWTILLCLLEIMGICFAQEVSFSSVINLKRLIKEHLTSFKNVYPNARILPKQHYLVHLPTQVMLFGPLIRSWCMRFEAKHLYFKNMARTIKNFKNLPLSLAKRHQSLECASSIQSDEESSQLCPFWSDIGLGKGRMLHGNDKDYALNIITRFYKLEKSDMSDSPQVYQYNSVTVYGTKYKPGANNFLLVALDETGLPQFGKLSKIWFVPYNKPIFVVMLMNTGSFL